jgi:phosphoribosylaminoimidazolecarboxamide formyltransferase/IMP cyclohydrolase
MIDNNKYALLSVYDKDNILTLAQFFIKNNIKLISTGGTYEYLKAHNIPVIEISSITNFEEMLDGRVKTLHPHVHAGILAIRNNAQHMQKIQQHHIKLIDYVVVNLYPFFDKVNTDLSFAQKLEFIDIGGPTMLRAAAKNYQDVVVVCDKNDYGQLMNNISQNNVCLEFKRYLAAKVFNLMSAYDGAVANFMSQEPYPLYFTPSLVKVQSLRYGENPHQSASFYKSTTMNGAMNSFVTLNGKELSYNNYKDVDVA